VNSSGCQKLEELLKVPPQLRSARRSLSNTVNRNGHPDFYAISVCLRLAEEAGYIIVEWNKSHWRCNRRSAYRVPPSHPAVRKHSRVTKTGKMLSLVSG
jgi:hypothetical protein